MTMLGLNIPDKAAAFFVFLTNGARGRVISYWSFSQAIESGILRTGHLDCLGIRDKKTWACWIGDRNLKIRILSRSLIFFNREISNEGCTELLF